MILIDTSVYIEAAKDSSIEKMLEQLSEKAFIHSCDVVEKEINLACDFLRRTDRRDQSERLKLIYEETYEGVIRTSERIIKFVEEYHKAAANFSKSQHKDIHDDFLIVASATVAGVKKILSFNRKTMASERAIKAYNTVNSKARYRTPVFLTTREELGKLLESL
ncbi:MAG: hypothetical protein HZB66_03290 [Candidatus Aenigmarchaeota archaeon]|nr:hypothetical protein [Candidatus Aenigmarchaeota archaeon]